MSASIPPAVRFVALFVLVSLVATPFVPAAGPGRVRVTGRVVDPDGRPVAGARVGATPLREMDILKDPAAWRNCRTTTGDDGGFALSAPAGVPLRLAVRAHRFAPRVVELPSRGEGTIQLGEVRLTRGAAIGLVLVDEEDRPVTGVPFELSVRGTSRWETRTLDEDDGGWTGERLVVEGLAPGTWKLSLDAAGHATVDLGEVELVEGKTTDLGKVVLRRGPAIEGIVLSPGGEPVAGARVTARAAGMAAPGRAGWKTTRTGEDGRFLLGGLAEGASYTVSVEPDEGAPWEGTAKPGDRLEVRLSVPGEIAGRAILGGERGGPATPLVVRYRRLDRGDAAPPGLPAAASSRWLDERRTFREADGSFRLRDLSPGTYRLVLEHPGALPRTLGKVEVGPGESVDLGTVTLDPGIELSGTVVDAATGEPVAGATVERAETDPFLAMQRRMDAADGEPGRGSRTDAKGRFTLGGLEPGRVVLEVRADGYATTRVETMLEEGTAPDPLRVELAGGGVVEGTVRRGDGSPAAGVKVMVMRGMTPDLDHSAETDAAGHYRLEHLAPGPTTIVAMLSEPGEDGFDLSGLKVRTVTVEAGKKLRVDFPEQGGGIVLSGRVLEGGRPVPAQLTFLREDGRLVSARADGEGRYRVELPAPGTWSVAVMRLAGKSAGNGTNATVLVASTTTRVEVPANVPAVTRDIHLPAATVQGTVRDPGGEPIAGATVVLRREDDDRPGDTTPVATSGRDGSFRLRWVPEGTWTLVGSARGHAFVRSEPFEVGEDGEVEVDLVLPPAEAVPVRVLAPSGEPLAGARVLVLDSPAPNLGPVAGRDTDDDGLVQLDTLPGGSWQVAAVSPRFGLALGQVLAPAPEGDLQEIDFEDTLPVTLVARDENGAPVRGVRLVSLRPANGPEALPAVSLATLLLGGQGGLVSGAGGRLSLPPLPPGKWTAEVRCPGDDEPVTVRFRVAGSDPVTAKVTCPAGS